MCNKHRSVQFFCAVFPVSLFVSLTYQNKSTIKNTHSCTSNVQKMNKNTFTKRCVWTFSLSMITWFYGGGGNLHFSLLFAHPQTVWMGGFHPVRRINFSNFQSNICRLKLLQYYIALSLVWKKWKGWTPAPEKWEFQQITSMRQKRRDCRCGGHSVALRRSVMQIPQIFFDISLQKLLNGQSVKGHDTKLDFVAFLLFFDGIHFSIFFLSWVL